MNIFDYSNINVKLTKLDKKKNPGNLKVGNLSRELTEINGN